jgi:hypothetical protein
MYLGGNTRVVTARVPQGHLPAHPVIPAVASTFRFFSFMTEDEERHLETF